MCVSWVGAMETRESPVVGMLHCIGGCVIALYIYIHEHVPAHFECLPRASRLRRLYKPPQRAHTYNPENTNTNDLYLVDVCDTI